MKIEYKLTPAAQAVAADFPPYTMAPMVPDCYAENFARPAMPLVMKFHANDHPAAVAAFNKHLEAMRQASADANRRFVLIGDSMHVTSNALTEALARLFADAPDMAPDEERATPPEGSEHAAFLADMRALEEQHGNSFSIFDWDEDTSEPSQHDMYTLWMYWAWKQGRESLQANGWRLVPPEHTPEMEAAFFKDLSGACCSYFDEDGFGRAYQNMINAETKREPQT